MTNRDYLEILAKGVEIWNEWRSKNPNIIPNLKEANLRRVNLVAANLCGVNLRKANLIEANIRGADLSRANLIEANLSTVNLRRADLNAVDIRRANLLQANLSEVNLLQANLSEANLLQANLSEAILRFADLSGADLSGADLSGAYLNGVNFARVTIDEQTRLDEKWHIVWKIINYPCTKRNLERVDLSGSNLYGVNLSGANLIGTNLRKANLSNTNLHKTKIETKASHKKIFSKKAQLDEKWQKIWKIINQPIPSQNLTGFDLSQANFTGINFENANFSRVQALNTNFKNANLTGICIQEWNINSDTNFDNVICEYIYLKSEIQKGEGIVYTDRRPSDPSKIFAPGDFARLIEQARETVDLIFSEGIDWSAFLNSFKSLQVEGDYGKLSLQAIEKKCDGFVVKVEVPESANKGEIETNFKLKYETELKRLENQYRSQLQAKDREIEIYKQKSADIMELARLAASRPITIETKAMVDQSKSDRVIKIENNEIKGAAYSEETKGSIYTGGDTIYNEAPKNPSLVEAAQEIQDLLKQLEATNPTETPLEQMAIATEAVKQIENDPTLKQKAINAAKEGAIAALKQTSIGAIVVAAIEGWTKS